MTYFKAIRPNGTDFRTGKVRWAPADEPAVPGSVVRHPWSRYVGQWADSYLSVSTVATDCTGMDWPCRLLEVEPVDEAGQVIEPVTPEPRHLPNKRAAVAWRVVRELDPMLALGPQGEQIVALLERASRLTNEEMGGINAQYRFQYATPWATCKGVAGDAAVLAGRVAAWEACYSALSIDALHALLVRDLIGQYGFTQEHYDTLTGPWRRAIGPIHPDDKPLDTANPA